MLGVNKLKPEWKVIQRIASMFRVFLPKYVTNRSATNSAAINSRWFSSCTKRVQTICHLEVKYADIGALITDDRFTTNNANRVISHQSSSDVNLSQSVYCYLSSSVYLVLLNSSHHRPRWWSPAHPEYSQGLLMAHSHALHLCTTYDTVQIHASATINKHVK